MRKIIYTRPDGGLSVVHPVRNTHPVDEELSDEEVESRAWNKLPADAINPQFVAETVIPQDRTFRNGWKAAQGTVEHDMPKCRELQRQRLREARAPLLQNLDVEFIQALERDDSAALLQIKTRKQTLRDITAHAEIEAARTVDELKRAAIGVIDSERQR